jgi:hypothetical protein
MLPIDWPTAIAHIDADCFYAACERAWRPELRKVPVCVLSSQDACVAWWRRLMTPRREGL